MRPQEIFLGFGIFGFEKAVEKGINRCGYTAPTPIQTEAIPTVMAGGDVMGLAQTGTGKTAAFVLPILHRLVGGQRGRVRALIIAPTRELALQIEESVTVLASETGLKSTAVFGGVSVNRQIAELRSGVDIVVACPGRLLDHMSQGTVNLSALEVLVLDEADQMFDMGFLPDIRRILKQLPAKRQTLLFSATMPEEIRKLAADILQDPKVVQVGRVAPAVTVTHALYPVPQHLKTALLLEILKHTGGDSVLVFTRTKHRAKRLGEQLTKAGYKAASLQGNLSQNRRQEAMEGFRSGAYRILAATDIAARGIDVSQISHVINFDIPETPETYIHRIGRTGRAAKTGDAFTFITTEDESMVRAIERLMKKSLERRTVEGFDYTAPPTAEPPRQPHPRSHGPREAAKPGAVPAGKKRPAAPRRRP